MSKQLFIAIFLFLITAITANGQAFHNLDFQQRCDTSKTGLCYWGLSWGAKGNIGPALVNNEPCLLIQGKNVNAVGFVEQAVQSSSGSTRILTVTATIQSDSIEGKGAGLNIGLYDKAGNLIASKDMGGFYSLDWIKGTNTWNEHSISLVCPMETEKIKIGMILFGKGKAWFSNYKVSLVPINKRKPSKLAIQYISAVCDTIKMNSLVRDSIDIKQLRKTALQIAGPAKEYSDCYLAVGYLLESLRPYGDHHSFFMTAKELKNWKEEGSQVSKIQYPSYKVIDSCGYITVPAFHGGNPALMLAYADSMQAAIELLSHSNIKGWIVDLRENTGGNMSPMIAGLGPLFSASTLGSLVDVNGRPSAWHYENGKYFWDNDTGWSVSHPVILNTQLPIAVLTSNQTGSSGEAVTVSFIGNHKTKSFGQSTWGLTTGNGSFDLKDGSQIFLASTIMADRNNRQYKESIAPDMVIDDKNDAVMIAAVKWIMEEYGKGH
jgi:carboxyl-terminal processing protease